MNTEINGAILFVVDTNGNGQARSVGYYRKVRQAKAGIRPGTKDYLLRRSWTPEQWVEHAERMVSQDKIVSAKWWATSKKVFAWGKSVNQAKTAYKLAQSQGRKAMREREESGVDEMGKRAVYTHQFAFSV